MRKTRTLLTIIAIIALFWLVRSFLSDTPLPPVVIILILGFLLIMLLVRRSTPRTRQTEEIPPSQRRRRKTDKHKSWITRIDQE
ncbi:MAG: hypothetical protein GX603_06885 [Chloroflexi bacterium]|nr:hypothetical protein [Chloroflexota bacterium]